MSSGSSVRKIIYSIAILLLVGCSNDDVKQEDQHQIGELVEIQKPQSEDDEIEIGNGYEGWIEGTDCEATENELRDINEDFGKSELTISESQWYGSKIPLSEITDWEGKITVQRNGAMIKDAIVLSKDEMLTSIDYIYDQYEFTYRLHDDFGRRSKAYTVKLKVYDKEDLSHKSLYKEMDKESVEIDIANYIEELTFDETSECFMSYENGQLISWYKVWHNGSYVYFCEDQAVINNVFVNVSKFRFVLNSGEIIEYDLPGHRIDPSDSYLEHGFYNIGSSGVDKDIFIQIDTGEIIEIPSVWHIYRNNIIVSYDKYLYDEETEEERSLTLYRISNDGIEKIYEDKSVHLGFDQLNWTDSGDFIYTRNKAAEDQWASVRPYPLHQVIQLTIEDESVISEILSDDLSDYEKQQGNIEIHLYSEMSETSDQLGMFNRSDLNSLSFTRYYDIIDKKLVVWFKTTLDDGIEAYAYRERTEFDTESVNLQTPMYITYDDGNSIELKPWEAGWYGWSVIDELLFMDLMVLYLDYEGHSTFIRSAKDGSELNSQLGGFIKVSPDRKHILDVINRSEDGETKIRMYDIDGSDLKLAYEFKSELIYYKEAKWLDDNTVEILFSEFYSRETFVVQVKYDGNEWRFDSDRDLSWFKNEIGYTEENTIIVNNAQELIENLKPNHRYLLNPYGDYDLSLVDEDLNPTYFGKTKWGHEFIQNLENVVIEGIGNIPVDFESKSRTSDAIEIRASKNITLKNLNMGHHEDVEIEMCSGVVVDIVDSEKVNIVDSILFGSGMIGIQSGNSSDIYCDNTVIYDCSWQIMSLNRTRNVLFDNCTFINEGEQAIEIIESADIEFRNSKMLGDKAKHPIVYSDEIDLFGMAEIEDNKTIAYDRKKFITLRNVLVEATK